MKWLEDIYTYVTLTHALKKAEPKLMVCCLFPARDLLETTVWYQLGRGRNEDG
jgi:hypothetical protein